VGEERTLDTLDEIHAAMVRIPVGYLGMVDEDGPYVVPISFAPGDEIVYFHGGEGKKSAALARDPRVCLTVVSEADFLLGAQACKDNFRYSSVLVFGRARLLTDPAERNAGLRALVRKYHTTDPEAPLAQESFARTLVYAIESLRVTAKEND
jgi:nitroimidazol reductase NimA-like FMN-containing flavoprotein (pyridoxamine 5'-phosphate oxidase superfamily)